MSKMKLSILFLCLSLIITMMTGCYTKEDAERDKIYDSIVEELFRENIVPSSWKYVDKTHGWGMETPDYKDAYYFYIDKENYDEYKHYWLEDVDESEMTEGMNEDLSETGERVFHAINVYILSYTADVDYGDQRLKKDEYYYLVQLFDNSLYYKTVGVYHNYGDKKEDVFYFNSKFECKNGNVTNEYMLHQENGKWVIEELRR